MPVTNTLRQGNVTTEEVINHKTFTLNSGSEGVTKIPYISGSVLSDGITPTITGSYYQSLRLNFYASSSGLNQNDDRKYKNSEYSLGLKDTRNPQFKYKFYKSGSIISIPQQFFGEEVKPGSFKLTDRDSYSGVNPIIKDDGYGNLYSTNAYSSQSATTHLSSSDNYVGNIFYNLGIVSITETGSWSGSKAGQHINYPDLFDNFDVNFESTTTSYVKEFTIKAKKGTFNMTNNITSRIGTGSFSGSILRPQLTGSDFTPYMTQIELYGDDNVWPIRPIIRAKYPQPIKMRNDIDIIFRIKIDF